MRQRELLIKVPFGNPQNFLAYKSFFEKSIDKIKKAVYNNNVGAAGDGCFQVNS